MPVSLRVLVVATPMPGHVLPLVPLARAFRDAGHEVTVATCGDALRACPADLATEDLAPGLRLMPLMLRFALAHPRLARDANAGRDDPQALGLLWAPVNRRMARCVLALAGRVGPDLVVQEPFAVAAAQAATRRGVPSAVDPPAAFVTTAPPSLVGARPGLSMRYVPPGTGDQAPEDLAAPGERPRLVVSRSTVVQPGRDRLMSTVVAAAADTDLEVLLVRPDKDVSRRPLPPNVATTEWVSFPAVLPTSAGLVHHGGAGTVLTALASGTPQLVLRGPGDRRAKAEMVAARGAGIAADLDEITPAALRRLVEDGSLAAAAREVAAEIAARPAPEDLVGPLVGLAGGTPAARHGSATC